MEHPCFVGIDVSKGHLDVYVRPSGESFRVDHDDAGFATLIARMRPLTPIVVVLEATGGYEVTVAAALDPEPPCRRSTPGWSGARGP